MYSEDEAKTKWCPFARTPLADSDGAVPIGASVPNRRVDGRAPENTLCIGSACMAWQWDTEQHRVDLPDKLPANTTRWRYVDANDPLRVAESPTSRGYCGLAR